MQRLHAGRSLDVRGWSVVDIGSDTDARDPRDVLPKGLRPAVEHIWPRRVGDDGAVYVNVEAGNDVEADPVVSRVVQFPTAATRRVFDGRVVREETGSLT
ncbi:hypothetical protein [Rathayibacter tanaceti]|uniref:hypothetical protein n=1 Tax=Rathayibacter tanaceti TaxID=1671680 RepID=UPI0012903B8B|nr:hypothetical protein [Rathayibacter tanaceti]